jgi:hypothetical protein
LYTINLDPKVGACIFDVAEEPLDAHYALVHPPERGQGRPQLDIVGAAGKVAVNVPRIDRRDRPLDRLHVRLRNTRSPRPFHPSSVTTSWSS